ncbi:hypothetical protein IW262DRAFT_1018564 [Armillaria fumosa]|nr:hypothetical protein IW262DRAFT_1018564 [Armillaria fumosa]
MRLRPPGSAAIVVCILLEFAIHVFFLCPSCCDRLWKAYLSPESSFKDQDQGPRVSRHCMHLALTLYHHPCGHLKECSSSTHQMACLLRGMF